MSSRRRVPLLVVLAVLLAVTGVATTLRHPTNPSVLPNGLAVSLNAESTALYCTGLSSASPGRVSFFNTANAARRLSVSVVSDLGTSWSGTIELAAHAGQVVQPKVLDAPATHRSKSGHVTSVAVNYAVAVQISGGGVVGDEIQGNTSVPCVSEGVTRWFAAGFNTLVGSDAYLSLYNPTDTEAVLNVSVVSATGFSAPENLQGVSVPAHAQEEIDLGRNVVNMTNVAVGVKVLRGSLAIVGEEDSAGTLSFNEGVQAPSTHAWFPAVTTANAATAEIRLSNPNNKIAHVTLDVSLGHYTITPQTTTLGPFTTGEITLTPNSAIPVAGYAEREPALRRSRGRGSSDGDGLVDCPLLAPDSLGLLCGARLHGTGVRRGERHQHLLTLDHGSRHDLRRSGPGGGDERNQGGRGRDDDALLVDLHALDSTGRNVSPHVVATQRDRDADPTESPPRAVRGVAARRQVTSAAASWVEA